MNLYQILMCLLCALGTAVGQLLFKLASDRLRAGHGWESVQVAPVIALSFAVYVGTSFFWVWVLRSVPLSRGYAVLSLVYLMVPVGASFLFRETLTPMFWAGAALICAGIVLTTQGGTA